MIELKDLLTMPKELDSAAVDYWADTLVGWLPAYEREDETLKNICRACAVGMVQAWQVIAKIERNNWIDTAVERLDEWERLFAISSHEEATAEERRTRVQGLFWSLGRAITWDTIRNILEAYTGGAVEMERGEPHGHYIFKYTGTIGRPERLGEIEEILKRITGAQYTWEHVFRYNTWQDVAPHTWQELEGRTWQEVAERRL